jgi:hypothetical protein
MNKQTISEALEGVEKGFSSIYSKDDVLQILNSIEEQNTMPTSINNVLKSTLTVLITTTINHLQRQVNNSDLDNGNDYFDSESARFELSGNEISVYSIDAEWDKIKNEIEYFIDDNKEDMIEHLMNNIIPTLSVNVIDDMKEEEETELEETENATSDAE